jgi:hypothetical protein
LNYFKSSVIHLKGDLMTKSNFELLRLAAKANGLATRLRDDVERPRLAARVVRHPEDVDARALSIVYDVKHDGSLADAWRSDEGLVFLHCAIAQTTQLIRDDLWYDIHPDRLDQLRAIWQERAVAAIRECGEEWILEVENRDEYIQVLLATGADKETAEGLADWLDNVRRAQPGEEEPKNDTE